MGSGFLTGVVSIVDSEGNRVDTQNADGNHAPVELQLAGGFTAVKSTNGALTRVTLNVNGGGGAPRTIATYDLMEALTVAGDGLSAGVAYTVQEDPTRGPWVWDTASGAGLSSDRKTMVRLGETSFGTNGVFYNSQGAPVLPTLASLRAATSGVHERVQVLAFSTLGDGGGGIWNRRSGLAPIITRKLVCTAGGISAPRGILSGKPNDVYDPLEIEFTNGSPETLVSGNVRFRWRVNGGAWTSNVHGASSVVLTATGWTLLMQGGTYDNTVRWKARSFRDDTATQIVLTDDLWYQREFVGPVDIRWAGAKVYSFAEDAYVGNGGVDSTDNVQTALDTGRPVYFPGWVRCATKLYVRNTQIVTGYGIGACGIVYDSNDDCMLLEDFAADSATIKELSIITFTPENGKRGIVSRGSKVKIRACSFGSTGGHAIQMGEGSANSHAWQISNCEFSSIGIIGEGYDPADALFVFYGNAGSMIQSSILGATGWGFRDESNLGNYYGPGIHIEATTLGGFKVGIDPDVPFTGTNFCTVESVYTESPINFVGDGTTIIGGLASDGYKKEAYRGGALVLNGAYGNTPVIVLSGTAPPSVDGVQATLGSTVPIDPDFPNRYPTAFMWSNPYPFSNQRWGLDWVSSRNVWAVRMDHDEANVVWEHTTYFHERQWNKFRVPRILIGDDVDPDEHGGLEITSGPTAPDEGIWYEGQRKLCTDSALGIAEWVCRSPGGFGAARGLSANKGNIITVAGNCYEATTAGSTAGSPPTFNHSTLYTDTTVDGGVTWRWVGTDPPVFEKVWLSGPRLQTQTIGAATSIGHDGTRDIDLVGPDNALVLSPDDEGRVVTIYGKTSADDDRVEEGFRLKLSNPGNFDLGVHNESGALCTVPAAASGMPGFVELIFKIVAETAPGRWKILNPGNSS